MPQLDIILKDRNTNLVMTLRVNTNKEKDRYVMRTNYSAFDDTIDDLERAYVVFIKTNEYLFKGLKDHPDYQKTLTEYKAFIDKDRGKFLDGDYYTGKFGVWEYSFSGVMDDASLVNRQVLDEEIEQYDKTE